jgi:NTE family protein
MSRALVLSGGGSVGIAWQTGLAAGLATKGVDLAAADFVLGTSAGSAVGARLALGRDMIEATERYREQAEKVSAAPDTAAAGGIAARMMAVMQIMNDAAADPSKSPEEMRAAIGAAALVADTMPEDSFVAYFDDLAGERPPAGYACTAIDALTGALQVWDASSDVPLDRAVTSSCAVPGMFPPITINGRRYVDGGMRSVTNADLAVGHDVVLIVTLAPPARIAAADDPRSVRMRGQMDAERTALRDAGATVEMVGPDEEAAAVMGVNLMDPAVGPAAAATGFRQGGALAATLGGFWA